VVRKRYEINVWGTVLYLDLGSSSIAEVEIDQAVESVRDFVYEVDEVFSTYKEGSFVSRLRRSEIDIAQCPADLQEVWSLCVVARELTEGAFDPWAVSGGFDPSGYVKGWAADRVAQILIASGCEHIQVNAAGDLTLRGGINENGLVGHWKIGVVNPDNRQEVLRIFEINDGAIATSGTYEKGAHIFDPATGTIAIGAKSATVLGPDGGLTDALATALMVAGEDGAGWFAQPELSQYSAWVIDRHSGGAWGVGPALL
jgi:thiamine biosynthesis lipoprotein